MGRARTDGTQRYPAETSRSKCPSEASLEGAPTAMNRLSKMLSTRITLTLVRRCQKVFDRNAETGSSIGFALRIEVRAATVSWSLLSCRIDTTN